MENFRSKLEEILLKTFAGSDIYGRDNSSVPSKKISNIRDVHNIKKDEEIFLVYDDTLFGSAKDGMAISDKAIYWREKFGRAERLSYSQIVASTANKSKRSSYIYIFDENGSIETNSDYHNIIADIKEVLINNFPNHKEEYDLALLYFEEKIVGLFENEKFDELMSFISKYEGLFLREKDKTSKIRETLFGLYLERENFDKAREELNTLENDNTQFYEKAKDLLEYGIKEKRYSELEEDRIRSISWEDFHEAREILEEQKKLGIKEEEYLLAIELEIKEAQYNHLDKERKEAIEYSRYDEAYEIVEKQKEIGIKSLEEIEEITNEVKLGEYESLDIERLEAVEKEEFNIAFALLEKQENLNIKSDFEIEEIKSRMVELKKEIIQEYHEELKEFVESELFLESKEMINRIYKIDPGYNLDREEILLKIYGYELDRAEDLIIKLEDLSLKTEMEEIYQITIKMICHEMRRAARNKDYDYFKFFPNLWTFQDEFKMTPIHYLALEGETSGIQEAYRNDIDLRSIDENVFGHSVIDLLGLACDPNYGDKDEKLIDLLNRITYYVEGDSVKNRIKFLEEGIEEEFLSYNISEELLNKIDYKEKERLEDIRLKELNDILMSWANLKKINQNLIDLERLDGFLELMLLYFPIKAPTIEIGNYDEENEKFYVLVNGKVEKMPVAKDIADDFKEAFDELDFICTRIIEDDLIVDICIYEFKENQIILPFKKRNKF